jgi:hypothetical protein
VDAYSNASQADITFWVWDAPPQTARALSELANVADAELQNNYFTKCKWAGKQRDVYLWGLDFSDQHINQIKLLDRAPNAGEFVAEVTVKYLFPAQIGDTISCRGRDGSMRSLALAGFAARPNYPTAEILDFATVYANAEDVQRLLGISGANQALLKIQDPAQTRRTVDEAVKLFRRRDIDHGSPDIRDPQNYLGKRELDALFMPPLGFFDCGSRDERLSGREHARRDDFGTDWRDRDIESDRWNAFSSAGDLRDRGGNFWGSGNYSWGRTRRGCKLAIARLYRYVAES